MILGFLPVIFSWLRARRQSQPLRLPSDSEEEPAAGAKAEVPLARLHGWKVFLLWFPAVCDLTATTVRPPLVLDRFLLLMTPTCIMHLSRLSRFPLPSQCGYTVDERRPALHPGLDLSDDPRRARPLCRCSFCHLSP